MNDQPFLKFFHRDWLADSALRMCSRAARGLWIDMLSLMADAEEFGVLPFGITDAPEALSNACGGSPKEIETLLRELGRRGVYSVREDGYIYSRRLVRDHQKFIVMSRLGKNGARSRYNENSDSAIAENAETAIAESGVSAMASDTIPAITENTKDAMPPESQKLRDSHLVTLGDATSAAEAAPVALIPGVKPAKSRTPRQQKIPDPHQIAAYQLLDAVYPVVVEHHEIALSRQAWRDRNKAAALDFVRQGKTSQQVLERLRAAYSGAGGGFYGGIVMLAKLAEHWAAIGRDDSGGVSTSAQKSAIEYLERNGRSA